MRRKRKSSARSTGPWSAMMNTLERHKRFILMRRLYKIAPLMRLALIFRAQAGDREAQCAVSIAEAELYEPAATFAEFLAINDLPAFEEVLR